MPPMPPIEPMEGIAPPPEDIMVEEEEDEEVDLKLEMVLPSSDCVVAAMLWLLAFSSFFTAVPSSVTKACDCAFMASLTSAPSGAWICVGGRQLLRHHSSWHLELLGELPRVARPVLVLRLVHGLHDDDVVLSLQGKVLGSKAGQLELDLELVVAGGHLDVVGSLPKTSTGHPHCSGAELGQPPLEAGAHAVLQIGEEGIGEEGRPLRQLQLLLRHIEAVLLSRLHHKKGQKTLSAC